MFNIVLEVTNLGFFKKTKLATSKESFLSYCLLIIPYSKLL